ncbi:MAG TPA: hypothetical protein VGP24_13675 [Glaciihabitans sp.]|jgi:hypothetical protein|nr:hypothetical protein [Glaciihabitans sp.]
MTLIAALVAATTEEHHNALFMPPIAFGAIAFAAFLVMGVVTWSYRDVANRHSQKFGAGEHNAHDSHTDGH